MITVDRLLGDLRSEGTVLEPLGKGRYRLHAWRGAANEPAAMMTLTTENLGALMASFVADDPRAVFPDRDRETAAYFLLLARLDEEVARYEGKIRTLNVRADDIVAIPSGDLVDHRFVGSPTAPGDLTWETGETPP